MKKKNAVMNSVFGFVNKIVTIFSVFVVRWVFVRYLDIELLGLEGLFANVFGVFSLLYNKQINFNQ